MEKWKSLALEGLKLKGLADKQEYLDRLDEELKIIKDKKLWTLLLGCTLYDCLGQEEDIMVGPEFEFHAFAGLPRHAMHRDYRH